MDFTTVWSFIVRDWWKNTEILCQYSWSQALDRSVPLTPQLAEPPFPLPVAASFRAEQKGQALHLRLVRDDLVQEPPAFGRASSREGPCKSSQTLCELAVDFFELKALGGARFRSAEEDDDNEPPSLKGEGLLGSVLRRCSVEWLAETGQQRRPGSCGDLADGGTLKSETQGRATLSLDRVVHQEVRRVSGVSLALRASVRGRSVLFEAQRVGARGDQPALISVSIRPRSGAIEAICYTFGVWKSG